MIGVIRKFMDGRAQEMAVTEPALDPAGEDIQEMRALLTDLNISSPSQSQSPATTNNSVYGSPEHLNAALHMTPEGVFAQGSENNQDDIYQTYSH